MPKTLPRFAVTTMMREEPAVIRRFADFYRRAGASEIFVFHDGPVPGGAPDLPGVELRECGAAFWQEVTGGPRPHDIETAQEATHRTGLARTSCEWLLVADADEFVVGDRPIAELLATVGPEILAVRVRSGEAVWGPGDDPAAPFGATHFRTALPGPVAGPATRVLYGRLAPFFRDGLLSHTAGKHFVRKGGSYSRIDNHDSFVGGRKVGVWSYNLPQPNRAFFVAHYDAVSFPRWREKWRRRLSGEGHAAGNPPHRLAQMDSIRTALEAGEDEAWRLFLRFNRIDRAQRAALRALRSVERRQVF